MKIKILEFLKRPFFIALWVLLLAIVMLRNDWGINFDFHIQVKSSPKQIETPANPALRTQVIYQDPVIGHRDEFT